MGTSTPNNSVRVHIWITGRVQGVGFRAFVQQWGTMLGLAGWVRNVDGDMVETVVEGPRDVVERFVEIVRAGPKVSRVDNLRVDWEDPLGNLDRFQVRF